MAHFFLDDQSVELIATYYHGGKEIQSISRTNFKSYTRQNQSKERYMNSRLIPE